MKENLQPKLAFVTGGTRGIGRAIARSLVEQNIDVLITGTGESVTDFKEVEYFRLDCSNTDDIHRFSDLIQTRGPDILINNAGINIVSSFEDIHASDFLTIQKINLLAPMSFCKAAVPHMRRKSWGRIVNVASIWSKISKAGRASYSASKFGLDGLTAALAAEVARFGILANCVSPGFIGTDLTRETLGLAGIQEIVSHIPMGRLGEPDEIAKLVRFLVSSDNTYISGQNIVIDGGFTRV